MTKPTTFDFTALIEGVTCTTKVRVATDAAGKPWLVAADIFEAAAFPKGSRTYHLKALQEDERGVLKFETPRGRHSMTVVSESGLFRLLNQGGSRARPFQDWVNREVLPSIRKTGGYQLGVGETMPLPTSFAEALRQHADTLIKLAEEQEKHAATEEARKAAVHAREQAEAEVARVAPRAAVADRVVAHKRQPDRHRSDP